MSERVRLVLLIAFACVWACLCSVAARLWVPESWRQVAVVPVLVALSVVYWERKRRRRQSAGEEK